MEGGRGGGNTCDTLFPSGPKILAACLKWTAYKRRQVVWVLFVGQLYPGTTPHLLYGLGRTLFSIARTRIWYVMYAGNWVHLHKEVLNDRNKIMSLNY